MKHILLKQIPELILRELSSNSKAINSYTKTRKILKQYSKFFGYTDFSLNSVDILHESVSGEISNNFAKFIDELDKTRKYKLEIKYRCKTLLREIIALAVKAEETYQIPDYLEPLVVSLPRKGAWWNISRVDRIHYPLTINSRRLFSAILVVSISNNIRSLDELFENQNYREIYYLCKHNYPSDVFPSVLALFSDIKKRLGFDFIKQEKIAVPLKNFPPKLRTQIETFMKRVENGVEDDLELQGQAALNGIAIRPLRKRTVEAYITAFSRFFGKIKIKNYDDLELKSFMEIKRSERFTEEGNEYTFYYNPIIQSFRESEQKITTQFKSKGYDSALFAHLTLAIKTISAYNGIFSYHKDFTAVYSVRVDRITRRKIKELKKEVFDAEWLDGEITRLSEDFQTIVKKQSFKRDLAIRPPSESNLNMRLCLYFVHLVTLRYMGFRQQLLRNCKIGKNITFLRNGSVKFSWSRMEMKNNRDFKVTIKVKEHSSTHGLLLETLTTYYRRIYPYLKSVATEDLNNQFFVRNSREKIVRHNDDCKPFRKFISMNSNKFIEFGDRLKKCPSGMNPHFFRGFCSDWLVKDIGLSPSEAAKFIGDDEKTLKEEYLSKQSGFDGTSSLDKANLLVVQSKKLKISYESQDIDKLKNKYHLELEEKDKVIKNLQMKLERQAEENHKEVMKAINSIKKLS